jgi:hypothetical protein
MAVSAALCFPAGVGKPWTNAAIPRGTRLPLFNGDGTVWSVRSVIDLWGKPSIFGNGVARFGPATPAAVH